MADALEPNDAEDRKLRERLAGRVGRQVEGVASVRPATRDGWISWVVPAGLLFLLFRVTGIPATERQALRSRPDYAEYQQTTSAFVPLPPHRVTEAGSGV